MDAEKSAQASCCGDVEGPGCAKLKTKRGGSSFVEPWIEEDASRLAVLQMEGEKMESAHAMPEIDAERSA